MYDYIYKKRQQPFQSIDLSQNDGITSLMIQKIDAINQNLFNINQEINFEYDEYDQIKNNENKSDNINNNISDKSTKKEKNLKKENLISPR